MGGWLMLVSRRIENNTEYDNKKQGGEVWVLTRSDGRCKAYT